MQKIVETSYVMTPELVDIDDTQVIKAVMICHATLDDGSTISAKSEPLDTETFDQKSAEKLAYAAAEKKLTTTEGEA